MIEKYLYSQLINRLKEVKCEKIEAVEGFLGTHHLRDHISFMLLFEELNRILEFKKIVIFIDEFDGIPRGELENFLTSLRELYQKYKGVKQKVLYSVGLVGIRNITKLVVGGVSPFNIADQVTLPPFTPGNVRDLYAQYTIETNQPFTPAAVQRVHEETAGQPWLVNRLGTILTMDIKPETVEPIDEQEVEKAIHALLMEKNDHFDNLYEKAKLYKETFVEIVFDHVGYNQYDEEQSWLEQYGLIKNSGGFAVVSNNIYKAIFVKIFFREVQADEYISPREYVLPGNRLDMKRILLNFDRYITQIGVREFYAETKPYEKTGQFLLTAWLYQFVKVLKEVDEKESISTDAEELRESSAHQSVSRKMARRAFLGWGCQPLVSGLGRMDVILTYKGEKYIIETKVNRYDDGSRVIEEGVFQLSGKYLVTEDVQEGYLVVFDTRTPVGTLCEPKIHPVGDKRVIVFIIAIGGAASPT